MLHRRALLISLVAAVMFVGVLLLDHFQPFAYVRVRSLYRDAVSRAGRTAPANPDLVFLGIDAASVSLDQTDIADMFGLTDDNSPEFRALHLMSRRFPWSREVYALIVDRLLQAGARAVAFDLVFPGPSDDDAKFRAALDRNRDHVVIGSNFVDGSLTRPSETLIPQTSPIDSRIGYTNFWADEDDVVRGAQYRVTFAGVRETASSEGSEQFLSLASATLMKAGYAADVPRDLANHTFRFTAAPREGFPSHSLFEIFVPSFWQKNYRSGRFFQNKIVIVGADGNWQHDDHPTPFGRMPGAELHLNAMNAALHHEFIGEISESNRVLIELGAGLLAVLLSLFVRSPWLRVAGLLLLGFGAVWLGLFVFNHASVFLPLVAPLTQLTSTILFGLACDFTWERFEKNRLRRTLERYMSRDIVCEIIDRPGDYAQSLGGVVRPVAILFSDIRAYSIVAAHTPPEALVAQLNEYFTAMVECVFESGGTLDKFIGDAVMAVWGSLRSAGPRADTIAAIYAGLAMQKRLQTLNQTWRERGWSEFRIGIAVNHGNVIVGNIGSPQRMEFTVIGDAVNVTWKLQELTKELHTDLLISEAAHALTADEVAMRSVGILEIPGLDVPLEVFTLGSEARKMAPAEPGSAICAVPAETLFTRAPRL